MSRDIRDLERWIEKHPRLAYVYAAGISILICEVALILNRVAQLGARLP